jgi:hypothetical protein
LHDQDEEQPETTGPLQSDHPGVLPEPPAFAVFVITRNPKVQVTPRRLCLVGVKIRHYSGDLSAARVPGAARSAAVPRCGFTRPVPCEQNVRKNPDFVNVSLSACYIL